MFVLKSNLSLHLFTDDHHPMHLNFNEWDVVKELELGKIFWFPNHSSGEETMYCAMLHNHHTLPNSVQEVTFFEVYLHPELTWTKHIALLPQNCHGVFSCLEILSQ